MKSLSKILSLVVVSVFVLSSSAMAEFDGYFSDTVNHKYREVVKDLSGLGIVEGYKDEEGNLTGEYGPDNTILRAELLKIVLEAGHYGPFPAQDCFTDVKASVWYSGYACRALELDFVQGYSDGSFKPGKEVSFVEALKIMMISNPPTAMDWDTLQVDPDKDVLADDYWSGANWYEKGVKFASELEIIPTDVIGFDVKFKRGQMAEMYMRLSRAGFGELANHPGYNPEIKVTFETLESGLNVEEQYFALHDPTFDQIAPIEDIDYATSGFFGVFKGGFIETETSEGYRVTLNLPAGAVKVDSEIFLYPLLSVPFEEVRSDFMGNGVYVYTEYGITGHNRGWLTFDFSPQERETDPNDLWDYCRSDEKAFDPFQCANEQQLPFYNDGISIIHFSWDRGAYDPRLVPVYKISDNEYAVEFLDEGVFVPVFLTDREVTALAEQSAQELREYDVDSIIATGRALKFKNLEAGEKFSEKLATLADQDFDYADHYFGAIEILDGSNDVKNKLANALDKELGYMDEMLPKYIASLATAERLGIQGLPAYKTQEVLDQLFEGTQNLEIFAFEALREFLLATDQLDIMFEAKRNSSILSWLMPTAYAEEDLPDIVPPDGFEDEIRNALNELISQTNGDIDGLIMLSDIARDLFQSDIADNADEKAREEVQKAVANAPIPGDQGEQGCTLVPRTLENFAIAYELNPRYGCSDGLQNLLDLAGKATKLGDTETAEIAYAKAGF